jgi:tripartite-type tricarboxylate transporter receptor subunit TctC
MAAPQLPVNNVQDFITYTKANSDKLHFSSAGTGSPGHLAGEIYKSISGVEATHVPYKGGGPAMTDLLAGRVHVYMGSIPGILPFIKDGKLKVLGVAGIERSPAFPNIPTLAESVPGYEFVGTWYGMLTQTKVSPAIVARINSILNAALRANNTRQILISQGSDPQPTSVEEFRKFVRSDCPNWARAVKLAGIKPE